MTGSSYQMMMSCLTDVRMLKTHTLDLDGTFIQNLVASKGRSFVNYLALQSLYAS